jgi:hypothetical protein
VAVHRVVVVTMVMMMHIGRARGTRKCEGDSSNDGHFQQFHGKGFQQVDRSDTNLCLIDQRSIANCR